MSTENRKWKTENEPQMTNPENPLTFMLYSVTP